jgi:drug/metabolite transporter (DMT)-like permease
VVLGNRLGLLPWIAAALAAAGLFLLSGADQQGAAVGDLLELLCAAAFACHVLATNWATHRHPVGVLLTVQFALGGLVFLALAAGQGTLQPPRSGSVIVALLVTGVLASALAFFVQTYAQRYASPTRTALILASESAFAGLASYVFQNNRLTIAGWVGAGLILVAIVGVELLPRLRQPVATHVSR